MRDIPLIRRPALGDSGTERFGGVSIESLADSTVLHLLARPGMTLEADLATALGPALAAGLRQAGPRQWFLVADGTLSPEVIDGLAKNLAPHVALIDQSQGRVRLRVSGPQARALLAKGTGVDLHPEALPVGKAAGTLFGHIGVHLSRTAEDSFELLVLRGFAESLKEELSLLARPFAQMAQ